MKQAIIYHKNLLLIIFLTIIYLIIPSRAQAEIVWSETQSMQNSRASFTSNLLPNGKVLVSGGLQPGNIVLSSTEIFDPESETWVATDDLNQPRFQHVSITLDDGRIMAIGGRSSTSGVNALNSVEIYDPISQTWTIAANMHGARSDHTATLLQDGRVLVVGQTNAPLGSSPGGRGEIYNPATDTWTLTGFLNTARWQHSAALLPNGKVIISFGRSQFGGQEDSSEIYDLDTDSWTFSNAFTTGRFSHTATTLDTGLVLIAGGNRQFASPPVDVLIYNPITDSLSNAGNITQNRTQHNMIKLNDGKVALIGGFSNTTVATTEIYDPITNTWSNVGNMNTPRRSFSSILLNTGRVLAMGGNGLAGALNSTELYPATIPNSPPTADAGPDQSTIENINLAFDGSGSSDPDGVADIVSYNWDFGDGATASGVLVNHTYTTPGIYTVTLTVEDTTGEADSDTATITVNPDPLICKGFNATIVGTSGDDVIIGTSGPDVIVGLGGNDIIKGKQGDDVICGGDGDDSIEGDYGDDYLNGGPGNDSIYGNQNDDTIIDLEGNNTLEGGMGEDTITAGDGDDIVAGNQNIDIIYAGNGNNTIEGGYGDDIIKSGSGNDIIMGNQGADFLDAGSGVDFLDGGDGQDTCNNGETNLSCEIINSDE